MNFNISPPQSPTAAIKGADESQEQNLHAVQVGFLLPEDMAASEGVQCSDSFSHPVAVVHRESPGGTSSSISASTPTISSMRGNPTPRNRGAWAAFLPGTPDFKMSLNRSSLASSGGGGQSSGGGDNEESEEDDFFCESGVAAVLKKYRLRISL